jgi:hypothetical protein
MQNDEDGFEPTAICLRERDAILWINKGFQLHVLAIAGQERPIQ